MECHNYICTKLQEDDNAAGDGDDNNEYSSCYY